MRYISASGMHFRAAALKNIFSLKRLSWCCTAALLFCFSVVSAEVIDRVVAYVDETAITLSELKDYYNKTKKAANMTEEEALNSMINSLLLLKEAKAMKLEAHTDDELLKDYIDIKIGSLILIKENAVISFYNEHINEFKGQDYLTVRDGIENYLFELEINKQLKKHLEELRGKAEIKIQLTDK